MLYIYNNTFMKTTKRGDEPTIKIHNRLPVLRAERGLSRQELADAVGVNFQTIGYLERGDYNPSLELALQLSEFFNLPIEAIFSRQPFKPLSSELYARSPEIRSPEIRNPETFRTEASRAPEEVQK
jgi:putative transcriptional regulator